jgi:ATP-dependent RNA helicase RhlE
MFSESDMHFSNLGLSDEIVRAVKARGYTDPTPVQRQAIPAVLSGGDLLAGAQTGTGKTAGFALPILQRLSDKSIKGPSSGRPPIRALILAPTRELAAQVEESVRGYGKYLKLESLAIFGGVSINNQIRRLKSRVDILVATPGRLLDHVQQRTVDLSQIEILVLDEADRMLDMGFIRDIKRILALLPKQRQNLLFSATFPPEIKALAAEMLNRPAMIEVERSRATAELIAHRVYLVDRDRKRALLTELIKRHNWFQVLVFTRTKHGADKLAEQLGKSGIACLAIHGNKRQAARMRALDEFKRGSLQVLVATDIAARGIDISELPHVVNFDMPHVPEDYVHRIGRTGRAGVEGEAISLVCVDENKLLVDIERLLKRQLPKEVLAGFEPDPRARPEPLEPQRRRNGASAQQPNQGRFATKSQGNNNAKPAPKSVPKPKGEHHAKAAPKSKGVVVWSNSKSRSSGRKAGLGMSQSGVGRRSRAPVSD